MKVFVGGCSRCDWVYYQFAPLDLVTEQETDREYKTNVAGLILTIQEAVKLFDIGESSVSKYMVRSCNRRLKLGAHFWRIIHNNRSPSTPSRCPRSASRSFTCF